MTWRSGYRQKRKPTTCKCDHEQITHYTPQGNCVVPGCGCQEFRSKGNPKFSNIKRGRCQYNHSHDSGLETKTCFDLHLQKLSGAIKDFKFHEMADLPGPSGATVARYELDFTVDHNDGSKEIIECKGDHLAREQGWRIKWSLLQDKHKGDPNVTFRVVRG